jgi:hypothetical protein
MVHWEGVGRKRSIHIVMKPSSSACGFVCMEIVDTENMPGTFLCRKNDGLDSYSAKS